MSAGRPPQPIPFWGEDGPYPAGGDAWSGTVRRVQPSAAQRAAGWTPGGQMPAQWHNWEQGGYGDWLDYLADVGILNWQPWVYYRTSVAGVINAWSVSGSLNYSGHKLEPGALPFWFSRANAWVIVGADADGIYYWHKDPPVTLQLSTGGTFRVSFGVGADDVLLMFSGDVGNGADELKYSRSDPDDIDTWTHATLPGTVSSLSVANCVIYNQGRAIVMGGRNGDNKAWTSDDKGTTWTERAINTADNAGDHPAHVAANGSLLYACLHDVASVNGGDDLYKSTDNGTTWSKIASVGFDLMRGIVYMPSLGVWVVRTDTTIEYSADPGGGSWTSVAFAGGYGMAAFGDCLILPWTDTGKEFPYKLAASWDLFAHSRDIHYARNQITHVRVSDFGQFVAAGVDEFSLSLKLSGLTSAGRGE